MFFGRDRGIDRVCGQLNALAQRTPALLLLLGPSGTGKSSLVRAGVVPQLQADGERRWRVVGPFRPCQRPFRSLAAALGVEGEAAAMAEGQPWAEAGPDALRQRLDNLLAEADAPLLLVIDQFEELLLDDDRMGDASRAREPAPDDRPQSEAERFLVFLETLLRHDTSGLVVLATLRTDALDGLQLRWKELTTLAVTSSLEPIQPEDFGVLITGPAERVGLSLQPGLVERLVADSGGRDALPLLAFTLWQLWRKRDERGAAVGVGNGAWYDLTLADYEALGGVAGVVSRQAALCWDPLTSDKADMTALRQAFLHHLVRLNEEGMVAKHPARWGELPERSRPLLKRFVEERLLVSGGGDSHDQVEIAHEALLRTWEPLRDWIKEGRQEMEQRRREGRIRIDLELRNPLQIRLWALQGLLVLAEVNPQVVTPAVDALADVLTQSERDPREWPLAIRLLALAGNQASVPALTAFLDRRLCRELLATELVAPMLELLCQAAVALHEIHRRQTPCGEDEGRWLILPSARVNDDGRAVRTELVRLRLWATPRLEPHGAWFEPLGEGVALTLVAIPAGTFKMGSSLDEQSGYSGDESPQHLVRLQAFWMSQTPITQAQWRNVMDTNPAYFQGKRADADYRPVEGVSWHDAMAFCEKLSERSGHTYSLPTEAQWEYACRAGTTSPFHCGHILIGELANFKDTETYDKAPPGHYQGQTSAVTLFPANGWGLQDMHGNVWEWCLDHWHDKYEGAPEDGSAWLSPGCRDGDDNNLNRLLRGGSWDVGPASCRSASRNRFLPDLAGNEVGFRVVCAPQGPSLNP